MTDREKCFYDILMHTIRSKFYGSKDEHDVQRALGALYSEWVKNNDK